MFNDNLIELSNYQTHFHVEMRTGYIIEDIHAYMLQESFWRKLDDGTPVRVLPDIMRLDTHPWTFHTFKEGMEQIEMFTSSGGKVYLHSINRNSMTGEYTFYMAKYRPAEPHEVHVRPQTKLEREPCVTAKKLVFEENTRAKQSVRDIVSDAEWERYAKRGTSPF